MSPWNVSLDGVFGIDLIPDGRIIRNCLQHWNYSFPKGRCNGILVMKVLEHMAAETRNVDDGGGVIGRVRPIAIGTATSHLCDSDRSSEVYCDAEAVDPMLEI